MTRIRLSALGLAAALVLTGACAEPEKATSPQTPSAALFGSPGATLVECPTGESQSASGLVTPLLGGTVSAGGFSIAIPAGALLDATTITVTVPASRYLEVDIRANGQEHLEFLPTLTPVVVTLDYSRCGRGNLDLKPLTVWYIDAATKKPLENMGGLDNKLLRQITFTTPHLSGYALAN